MSPLRQARAGYLAVRRSLGYKLDRAEKLLAQFITYLEQAGAATVTIEHALAWAALPGGDANWHAHRLSVVRGFAVYLHTIDPAAEIPPAGLIPARPRRATPCPLLVAVIAARQRRPLAPLIPEMISHLRVQRGLQHHPGHPGQQPVRPARDTPRSRARSSSSRAIATPRSPAAAQGRPPPRPHRRSQPLMILSGRQHPAFRITSPCTRSSGQSLRRRHPPGTEDHMDPLCHAGHGCGPGG
jgi:hypothetical protein